LKERLSIERSNKQYNEALHMPTPLEIREAARADTMKRRIAVPR